ncbi:MAG TPA: transporter substrate-binding domain-containing protein [Candidatus Poseidoniales archaeon]|nr:transporter substrate-binding domain-containing protein [Candidatus Poseidoniales archaeon]
MNLKPIFGALFVAAFMLSLAAIPASADSVGYKIGVQSGTTSDTYAAESLPNAVVHGFDTIDLALAALKQGDVQFVMGDLPTLKFYEAEADSGVSVVGSFGAEDFGIGVPLGESELLDAINMALGEVISSGDYDAIFAVSFGNEIVVLTDDTDASTATAYPSATEGGKLDGILQDNGTIVFGSDTTYPPFESLDEDGNCVGFDCDIADAIAGKLAAHYGLDNFSATMKTKTWDELLAFTYDDYDATLSAMTKTVQRAEQTQFTRAYYSSKQGILGTPDSPAITGVDDLNTLVEHEHEDEGGLPGLSLLVSAGALGAIALRRRH